MSAIIAMNKDIEAAIKEMCADAALQATSALSEKYGFDEEEAIEFLKIKDIKLVRTRGPAPKSGKKLKKSKGDKPKTKRGMSGYNLHNKIERPSVKAELEKSAEESDETFKPTDVMTALAARWKALSDDERSNWNEKAKLENESSSDEVSVDEVSVDEEEAEEKKDDDEQDLTAFIAMKKKKLELDFYKQKKKEKKEKKEKEEKEKKEKKEEKEKKENEEKEEDEEDEDDEEEE